jgi:beta-lactamase superfamily II metal-dependent hydrolase
VQAKNTIKVVYRSLIVKLTKGRDSMKKTLLAAIVLLSLLVGCKVNASGDKYEVHLIDTGQSDCILIKGAAKNYLIDTGFSGTSDRVLKYLRSQEVNQIEDIIITHYHDDHYGGLRDIVKNKSVKVNRVILPMHQQGFRDAIFSYLLNEKVKLSYISPDYFIKDANMKLKVMLPEKEDMMIENNNSTIVYGVIDGIKYVFMADVEKEREKAILNNPDIRNCDIIKVAHHALDTSSSEEILSVVNPRIALVSCNGVESPSKVVINRLAKNITTVLRTDKHGDIVVKRGDKAVEITLGKVLK